MAQLKYVSYAGVSLSLSTPQLQRRMDALLPFRDFTGSDFWNFNGFDLSKLPTPTLPVIPDLDPGVLYWPTGATRPAWFTAVVNQTQADAIRDAVTCQTDPYPLVLQDGRTDKIITAQMYLLPFRPINQLGDDVTDGWLLTLTDQRFYWYWKTGSIGTKPSSWTGLYSTIADLLGIAITPDTVDSGYSVPSKKWVGYLRPLATVLDSVAAQIGQRVVVGLDGTVSTVNWTTAQTNFNAQADAVKLVAGGLIETEDIARYVPRAMSVAFADWSSGKLADPPFLKTLLLTDLDIPDYANLCSGVNATGTIYADYAYDGTNATGGCATWANVSAASWYGWRLPSPDLSIPGIEPWEPTGWEDSIEWIAQIREGGPAIMTRVRRGPWTWLPSGTYTGDPITPPIPVINPGTNCSSLTGLLNTVTGPHTCLRLVIPVGQGSCSCVEAQTTKLKWNIGLNALESVDYVYGCGTIPYTAVIDLCTDSCGRPEPRLRWIPASGSGARTITFSGAGCDGSTGVFTSSDPLLCTGTPAINCLPNSITAYVQCVPCVDFTKFVVVPCSQCCDSSVPVSYTVPQSICLGITKTAGTDGLGLDGKKVLVTLTSAPSGDPMSDCFNGFTSVKGYTLLDSSSYIAQNTTNSQCSTNWDGTGSLSLDFNSGFAHGPLGYTISCSGGVWTLAWLGTTRTGVVNSAAQTVTFSFSPGAEVGYWGASSITFTIGGYGPLTYEVIYTGASYYYATVTIDGTNCIAGFSIYKLGPPASAGCGGYCADSIIVQGVEYCFACVVSSSDLEICKLLVNMSSTVTGLQPPLACASCNATGATYTIVADPTDTTCTPTPPVITYNCVSGACTDPGDGSGEFTGPNALADCQAACGGVVSYNCVSGSCVAVSGTGGTYPTLAACEAVCTGGTLPSYCCPALDGTTATLTITGGADAGTYTSTYDIADVPGIGHAMRAIWNIGGGVQYQAYCSATLGGWVIFRTTSGSSVENTQTAPAVCTPSFTVSFNTSGLPSGTSSVTAT